MSFVKKPPKELVEAEAAFGGNPFVISCREWFDEKGFLTKKQKEALTAIEDDYDDDEHRLAWHDMF